MSKDFGILSFLMFPCWDVYVEMFMNQYFLFVNQWENRIYYERTHCLVMNYYMYSDVLSEYLPVRSFHVMPGTLTWGMKLNEQNNNISSFSSRNSKKYGQRQEAKSVSTQTIFFLNCNILYFDYFVIFILNKWLAAAYRSWGRNHWAIVKMFSLLALLKRARMNVTFYSLTKFV